MKKIQTDILLIGGGYVNYFALKTIRNKLKKRIKTHEITILMVSNYAYHAFHGFSGEAITNQIRAEWLQSDIAELIGPANFLHGTVTAIDPDEHRAEITAADGTMYSCGFNHSVIGIGAEDRTPLDPELPSRSPSSFARISERVQQQLETCAQGKDGRIIIAGGGYTGVEWASQIAERWKQLKRLGATGHLTVSLLHSGSSILPAIAHRFPQFARYAEKKLRKAGVDLQLNTRVASYKDGIVRTAEGDQQCDVFLSGITPISRTISGLDKLPLGKSKQIMVDPYLRAQGHPRIWAGGDNAHVINHLNNTVCPQNALYAIKHGEFIGRMLARHYLGKPLKPFRYITLGQAAALGKQSAICEVYGVPFTGKLAWLMRMGFFFYFFPQKKHIPKLARTFLLSGSAYPIAVGIGDKTPQTGV